MKAYVLAALYFAQAGTLLVGGCATLWGSQELALWLIATVGEERALGADNVVRLESGEVFLTNPAGMLQWSVPFWLLGLIQISAACTLLIESIGRYSSRRPEKQVVTKSTAN